MIIYEYNVSNDNNTTNIYLKLGKKGPNTRMCNNLHQLLPQRKI